MPTNPIVRVIWLSLGAAVALGLGRFAYALLAPGMQADLGWSYADVGWLNTANAGGYLIGALVAGGAVRMVGLGPLFLASAVVCAASLGLMAWAQGVALMSVLRCVAGVSGAFSFVAGGVVAAALAEGKSDRVGFIIGLYYAGPGIGIALSGALLPAFLDQAGSGAWRTAWIVLGAAALCLAALSALSRPSTAERLRDGEADRRAIEPFRLRACAPLILAYAIFGAGYIGYMTFMFAHLKELGLSTAALSGFWVLIGIATMASPFLWSRLLGRARHGWAFSLLTAVTAAGAALPLVIDGYAAALVSAALFGCAFFAVVASTTAFVRRNVPSDRRGVAIGVLTAGFGAGQVLGPTRTGWISDVYGDLVSGLVWSCVFLAIASGMATLQRDVRQA